MKKILILILTFMAAACSTKDEFSDLAEEVQIDKYIKDNSITVTEKTATGLRFVLTKANASGAVLKTGQLVGVKYKGTLMTGKEFDSGSFEFVLGVGQVVKGFDEGIAKLKVGEMGKIVFPSNLGYGARGAGSDIKPFTPLAFEIEILSAK